ncbi:hypothetical protein C1646_740190 [Rhizophagus diaphanus]|nr:hypothetical protein C1646_740190 [Rhizophagus diaphanus] [Rhizophagus sp. MUCL 43196]
MGDSIVSIPIDNEEDYKKAIDQIVVYQEDNSLIKCVTYSENDNSITRWIIENDSQQKPKSACVKLNIRNIILDSFVLNDKFLLYCYNSSEYNNVKYDRIARIDLEDLKDLQDLEDLKKKGKVRLIELKNAKNFRRNSMRVFSDGSVILVSLDNELKVYKIYKCFIKQKDDLTPIYEIEIPECLKEYSVNCFVYQTKLLLYCEYQMTLWNLKKDEITIEKRFFFDHDTPKIGTPKVDTSINVVINKEQTLLALSLSRVNEEGYKCLPLEFVTLQNGTEGLIITADSNDDKKLYLFLDPFFPSGAIKIIDFKENHIIITKSNRILSIGENNVEIKDGLDEDTFQQIFSKTDVKEVPQNFDFDDFLKNVDKHMEENKYKKHVEEHMEQLKHENKYKEHEEEYKKFLNIINDWVKFSKSYLKMLETAIQKKYNFVTESIFDKIFKYAENYSNMSLLSSIDLNLFDLNYYEHSKLVKKFILRTSLALDPVCSSVMNSTSPYESYSKDIYIKYSPSPNLFIKLVGIKESLKPLEETPSIRFIVPFSLICKYRVVEFLQMKWNPRDYFNDLWNLFDIGAYSLPIVTTLYWYIFKYGDVEAFYITNGMNPVFVESSANVFVGFTNSLLSMYLILLGTTDSLASNTYNSPIVAFFLFLFTFIVVIYLNNLFVGLLNLAIEIYNKNEKFLLQKAKIIAENEQIIMKTIKFRMIISGKMPTNQLKNMFENTNWLENMFENTNWIYIDIPENEVRELIRAIDSNDTKFQHDALYISKNLRNLLDISEPFQLERIQQQIIDLQKKLNELNEKISS